MMAVPPPPPSAGGRPVVTPAERPAVGLRGRTVTRPWGRLRVWRAGEGPALLAVHGLGGSGRYWGGLARLVAGRFTVVAPDLAGFGHSDKPDVSYDRTFHLDNLDAALADAAGNAAPVAVVGHSLGGVLAALWAARHPARVAALALVATPYPATDLCMPAGYQRTYAGDQRRSRRRLYAALQTAWPLITLPVRSRVFPRAVIGDYMRNTLQSYWGTARNVLWSPTTEPELAPLSTITAPVLLLTARDDRAVPADNADRWEQLLPGAARIVTTGGHQLLLRTGFADLAAWLAGDRVSQNLAATSR